LDDAENLSHLHLVAEIHEGLGAGRGCDVEGTHHRCGDDVLIGHGTARSGSSLRRRWRRRCARCRGRSAGCNRRRWCGDISRLTGHRPGDPQGLFAFPNFDFSNARLLEQFDHLLDLADIHPAPKPQWTYRGPGMYPSAAIWAMMEEKN